jgi:hypothetical protein
MTWICPECGKEYKNTNQWHSCARVDLADHLRNKSTAVRATLDKLLREARKFGEITVDPVKTAIQLRTSSTFLSIKPKRDHLDLDFQLASEVTTFPIFNTIRISKNRVLHQAVLEGPEDVDGRLVSWLREAYDLSNE